MYPSHSRLRVVAADVGCRLRERKRQHPDLARQVAEQRRVRLQQLFHGADVRAGAEHLQPGVIENAVSGVFETGRQCGICLDGPGELVQDGYGGLVADQPPYHPEDLQPIGSARPVFHQPLAFPQVQLVQQRSAYIISYAAWRLPEVVCLKCGEPAGWLSIGCVIEEDRMGFLCARHRKNHPHDNCGALLKVVNSLSWVCAAMRGRPNRFIESHAYPFRAFHGLWIQSTCRKTSAPAPRTGAFRSSVAPGHVLPPGTLENGCHKCTCSGSKKLKLAVWRVFKGIFSGPPGIRTPNHVLKRHLLCH